MPLNIDTTSLNTTKIIKNFRNMEVVDLDPLSKGSSTFPREIEVKSIDADGSKLIAVWDGFPSLAVGDFCVCQRDGIDTVLYVTGVSGATANNVTDQMADFFNGTFVETFNATVASDGVTVTMSLEQSGTGDLTMRFSDGYTTLDCTPAATIALTAGTDASPQGNWIYVLQSSKAITKSTSAWPTVEHIKIGFFFVRSVSGTQTAGGAFVNQNWNEHLMGTDNQGHLSHMARKIRALKATYFSGVDANGTSGYLTITASNVEFKSTVGVIDQMHAQTFPAFDTSVSSIMHVKNWSGDAYHSLTNLFDIVADSTGATIGANKWFNLVIWGVINKTGEHQTVLINLPSGFYTKQADAEGDSSGYDDFSIPREFNIDSSVGFLIVRITVQKKTTWGYGSAVDLRGQTPQTAASGAGSGVTAWTQLTDTPATLVGQTGLSPIVDSGETALEFEDARTVLIKVENTSGATADANDVGYIDEAGEYKTTTTEADAVEWCVVFIGGANNTDIYVTRRGRVTVAYTSTAPNAGEFLITSTSAGDAKQQTTMRPEIFAVCTAAGAGGTVEALLLTGSSALMKPGTQQVSTMVSFDDTVFTGSINGAPAGATFVYTVTIGNENTIKPAATNLLAKLRLFNSTRSEFCLVLDVDTGTNTVTVTDSAQLTNWQSTDLITASSQTTTSGGAGGTADWYEYEFVSELPALTRGVQMFIQQSDTAANTRSDFHPFTAISTSIFTGRGQAANVFLDWTTPFFPIFESRFVFSSLSNGAATKTILTKLFAVIIATP